MDTYEKSEARIALEAKIDPLWDERPVFRALDVSDGWLPLIDQLVDDLTALGPFTVIQIKEKFGGLRFYTNTVTDEQQARITEAENKSTTVCEECGETGDGITIGSWMRTLCTPCEETALARREAERVKREERLNEQAEA
jgi:hypothetical protein